MNITRQNYEHWFIDFIEGDLNPADEAMLRKFVRLNPDLANELEDISDFKLVPGHDKYPEKELLKQDPSKAINRISKFDRLSIAYLENDIDKNEQAALERFKQKPAKEKEFQLIQKTKLLADTGIVYPRKNKLKKVFVLPAHAYSYKLLYRVAAVFILLFGLVFIFVQNSNKALIGMQLSHLEQTTTSRKVPSDKAVIKPVAHKKEKQIMLQSPENGKVHRLADEVPEKLIARDCEMISSTNPAADYTAQIIINSFSTSINPRTKLKVPFGKSLLYLAKAKRKAIGAKISGDLKRNFRYKKINTDDGRTLIAFKAGELEYWVSKKQKNK